MNEETVTRLCLFCERVPAITWYGLCEACAAVPARRRVYRYGRGQTPEWEAHLLYLTERAKLGLPLFDVFTARTGDREIGYLLGGDGSQVFGAEAELWA